MMAGILCLAREAMLISGGPEYLGAVLPLEILSLVPLFRTMQQPLNMSFYTYEKTRTVFWLAGLKFAVEPLLYPLLIPRFGVSGVAISSLLSSVVVFGPTSYIADRLFPATAGLRRAQTLKAWTIAGVTSVAFLATHRLAEPWPRMAVRIVILAGALALLLFVGRMVRGEDLRSLARVTRRARAERALQTTATWLDRVQGRVRRATIAG
jgi:O-antigen/teichoic acid export membrane protein